MEKKYTILGIHKGAYLVKGREPVPGVPPKRVFARVRLFINSGAVDENFELPELPGPIPEELELTTYEALIRDKLNARLAELEDAKSTNDPAASKVHTKDHNADQAVSEVNHG